MEVANSKERAPHCHEHAHFMQACETCRRALANSLPYPVRKTAPLARSFGVTGDVTHATLAPGRNRPGDPGYSLSLAAIRFLLKLVWPFERII